MSTAKNLGLFVVCAPMLMMPPTGRAANTSADINTATTITASDPGEKTAAEYRATHPPCGSIIHYGKELKPVGTVSGDTEKDTVAYPVEQTEMVCSPERK